MSDPFVAEIRIFPFNFAPTGWALCNGQLMPISQNTALFSLLGTTYGGNGQTTFALPDLQGRFPMHFNQGPGLSLHDIGETGGSENVTLLVTEIPQHTHALRAADDAPVQSPAGMSLGRSPSGPYATGAADSLMSPGAIGVAGSSFPHNNMPPYLTFTFCIALQGIFPPRS